MSATEILNLDDLLPEQPRVIQLKGRDFLLPEPSLSQDLKVRQIVAGVEAKRKAGTIDEEEAFFVTMAEIIRVRVPDLPEADLESMSLARLTAVFRFVQGATLNELKAELARVEEEVKQAIAATEAAGEGAAKN